MSQTANMTNEIKERVIYHDTNDDNDYQITVTVDNNKQIKICVTDFEDMHRYSSGVIDWSKYESIPPKLIEQTIVALIENGSEFTHDNGSDAQIQFTHTYMGTEYEIRVPLTRQDTDPVERHNDELIYLRGKIEKLEKELEEYRNEQYKQKFMMFNHYDHPVQPKIDWMDFHQFMLANHTDIVLQDLTKEYRDKYQRIAHSDIQAFMCGQLHGLTSYPDHKIHDNTAITDYWTNFTQYMGCSALLNHGFFKPSLAFLTYMSTKCYRPHIINRELYFIHVDCKPHIFPHPTSPRRHVFNRDFFMDIGGFYLTCYACCDNYRMPKWTEVPVGVAEYNQYLAKQ